MFTRLFAIIGVALAVVFAAGLFSRCAGVDKTPEAGAIRVFRVDRVVSDAAPARGRSIAEPRSESPAGCGIVVRGGVIAFAGPWHEAARRAGAGADVVDLRPGVAVPGLVDAHAHLLGQGRLGLDLLGTRSIAEIQAKVAAEVARVGPGAWVIGRRWDQNDWPSKTFPTAADLDRVAPANPVVLTRIDGHALWANAAAMKRAGVDRRTRDPDGGKIHRNASGEPSGVFIDQAMGLVRAEIPPPTRAEIERAVLDAAKTCHRYGLTGIHDAGVGSTTLDVYRDLYAAGKLKLRIYAMIGGRGPLLDHYVTHGPEIDACEGRLTVRALKLYADGALGSRGAALDAPYSDRPKERGLLVNEPAALRETVLRAVGAGLQVGIHAIGDRANRLVLDWYEEATKAALDAGRSDLRLRIEHAQVMRLADIDRMARLRVVASMQPTHLTSDMPWAMDRLGPERAKGAYAWRRILKAGARIAGGSDFPVERVNPLLGLHAAITRRRTDEPGVGTYGAEQKMTPLEALRAFTSEAAYASFREDRLGTIEPGKWADITVLPVDPTDCDPEDLRTARVRATIVAGEVVYEAP